MHSTSYVVELCIINYIHGNLHLVDFLSHGYGTVLSTNLETTRETRLEDSLGVVLLRDGQELGLVLGAVAGVDLLEAGGVAHVVEGVVEAGGGGGGVDGGRRVLDPGVDGVGVRVADPLDDLGPAQVGALGGRVDAEGVAGRVGGLGAGLPEGADGLPVNGDQADVLKGDGGVQVGQSVGEDLVGNLDALEKLVVGLANGGTSDKNVVDVVSHKFSGGDGEFVKGLESGSVGDGGDVEEHLEALGVRDRGAVVEEDDGSNGRVLRCGNNLGNNVRQGVGVVSREVGNGLFHGELSYMSDDHTETYSKEILQVILGNTVDTSPDLGRCEGAQSEAGDNTKVAATTLQSPEEVGVLRVVGSDNSAVGEDNLVLEDIVSRPTVLVAVEVDTSSEKKAGHTDGRETTTSHGQVILGQILIHGTPAESRSQSQGALVI